MSIIPTARMKPATKRAAGSRIFGCEYIIKTASMLKKHIIKMNDKKDPWKVSLQHLLLILLMLLRRNITPGQAMK